MIETFLRVRWISAIAVVFSMVGATIMFVVGAVTTLRAIDIYLGGAEHKAFSDKAALKTTIEMISSLDQFLLALVLFIFAYGIFRLFIAGEDETGARDWFSINSVTDLKVKLLETIAILLAVIFLKGTLDLDEGQIIEWSTLVIPLAVGIFAISIWLIRRAH